MPVSERRRSGAAGLRGVQAGRAGRETVVCQVLQCRTPVRLSAELRLMEQRFCSAVGGGGAAPGAILRPGQGSGTLCEARPLVHSAAHSRRAEVALVCQDQSSSLNHHCLRESITAGQNYRGQS